MSIYTTIDDAIHYEIVEPIEATGEVSDAHVEFDVDAIAEQTLFFDEAREDNGTIRLDRQGYRSRDDLLQEAVASAQVAQLGRPACLSTVYVTNPEAHAQSIRDRN